MKYNLAILAAALIAAVYSDANTPKGAADRFDAKEPNPLAAPGVTVEDDGCNSVLITLVMRPNETWPEVRARAWATGAKWRRDNPGNRADFSVVGTSEKSGRRTATWSACYCRYTLDEC